jgi:hypothetical protein
VSDTLGEGNTENVSIILSGYSSRIFDINNVPIPDPVPPPNEWHTWKPAQQKATAPLNHTLRLPYYRIAHCPPSTNAPHQTPPSLYTLQAVAALRLLPNHIQNRVDQLSSLRVVSLRPVVSRPSLPEHEVVRPEDLSVRTRPHTVHRPRLQIHQHRARHVPPAARLIVIHIDPLQLQIRHALVRPRRVDAMLLAHHLPELRSDLVSALPSLDVQDLSHLDRKCNPRITNLAPAS